MPGHDGVWLASRLRDEYPDTAVIMATGSQDADVALRSLRLGVVDFLSKPFGSEQFRHALARGIRRNRDAEQARQRLELLHLEAAEQLTQIDAFLAATPVVSDADLDRLIDEIMRETGSVDHVRRVAAMATNMAVSLGIRTPELTEIGRAALLHDLGRVSTPAAILYKPSKLSDEEIAVVRQQPRLVSDVLARTEFLAPAAAIFERHDGSGYPFALRGEEIPRGARIIGVANTLDAMTHHRPYSDIRSPAEALFEIKRSAGTQFDPWAVEALFNIVHLHWPSVSRRSCGDTDAPHAAAPEATTCTGPAGSGNVREPVDVEVIEDRVDDRVQRHVGHDTDNSNGR
jgi:response regulator RpfG family c-di-GMP phosphodiesterase